MVHPSLSAGHLRVTRRDVLWTAGHLSTSGLDKAGDAADKATGGGHGDQIGKAEDAADGKIGK